MSDKVEALRTLLPLLEEYLDCIPGTLKASKLERGRGGGEGDSFGWMGVKGKMYSRYRLYAVRVSFDKLCDCDPPAAESIYYSLVRPWSGFRIVGMDVERGLEWMAGEIPGELPFYGETKLQASRRLRMSGKSVRQVARSLHMSYSDIAKSTKGDFDVPDSRGVSRGRSRNRVLRRPVLARQGGDTSDVGRKA